MNVIERTRRAIKAFSGADMGALSDVGWNIMGGSNRRDPSSALDYATLVGDPSMNAVASAVIGWVARTLPESPAIITETLANGEDDVIREHPCLELLRNPNPNYGGDSLMAATARDTVAMGNAYWRIARKAGGKGQAGQLFWIPQQFIRVMGGDSTSNFIDHYEYRTSAGKEDIDPVDIIHFRYGLDPLSMGRTGLSPLRALYRSLYVLNMGENFEASILRNHGAPGLYLALGADGGVMTLDEARQWRQIMLESTTGEHVGEPIVGSPGSTLTAFGYSPEQLSLVSMLDRPEALVCAATGINPVVLGLKVGLEHSTYSNMEEAQRAAYEKGIIPMKGAIAQELTSQLLYREFEKPGPLSMTYDYGKVMCLQDKEDDLVKRLTTAAGGPYLTPNEARVKAGLDPLPDVELDTVRKAVPPPSFGGGGGPFNNLPEPSKNGNGKQTNSGDRVLTSFLAGWNRREGGM